MTIYISGLLNSKSTGCKTRAGETAITQKNVQNFSSRNVLFWQGDFSHCSTRYKLSINFFQVGYKSKLLIPPTLRQDVDIEQLLVWQKSWLLGNRYEFRVQCECDIQGKNNLTSLCYIHTHTHARFTTVWCVHLTHFLQEVGLDGAISKLLGAVLTLNSTSVWEIDAGTLEQPYLWTTTRPS